MEFLTSIETSRLLGVSKRRVNYMCQNGEIPGAVKDGYRWKIPVDAVKGEVGTEIKPLPIGIADYRRAVTEYYYVDKTLLIKDILDYKPLVSLFTRPRRFGKSLNMDMLKVFFEKSTEDTGIYFKNTKIWTLGDKYRNEQGKYPVVALSFKDVKYATWADTMANLKLVVQSEYRRHIYLLDSEKLSESDKNFYKIVLDGTIEEAVLPAALGQLMNLLKLHWEQKVVVIIDEYDTPIQQGYLYGYYDKVIGFMRNFLSGGLKDNNDLARAFLTGILRVAKESIFSGLNNLNVNSILEERYSSYFGFTEPEVKTLLAVYGMKDCYNVVKEWYNGYHFGNSQIYNPWSVLCFVDNNAKIQAYWQATGSNSIISEIIAQATDDVIRDLNYLLDGKKVGTYIDTAVVYPEIKSNPSSVFSFLLMAGYLTMNDVNCLFDGNSYGYVYIPNREVKAAYEKEIISQLGQLIPKGNAISIQQALISNDAKMLEKELNRFLLETVSFYDTASEAFYHGMLLGLSALLGNYYEISSNREAGNGRYDVQLRPYDKKRTAYILELKADKSKSVEKNEEKWLEQLACEAVRQICDREYYLELKRQKYMNIVVYGVAFHKKKCHIEMRVLE